MSTGSHPGRDGITITLTGNQVGRVLREATGTSGLRGFILEQVDDLQVAVSAALANPELDSRHVSESALKILSVLCAFAPPGTARGIYEIAGEQGMAPSTAHRYAQTLIAIGLLERVPHTKKYRIPLPEKSASSAASYAR